MPFVYSRSRIASRAEYKCGKRLVFAPGREIYDGAVRRTTRGADVSVFTTPERASRPHIFARRPAAVPSRLAPPVYVAASPVLVTADYAPAADSYALFDYVASLSRRVILPGA